MRTALITLLLVICCFAAGTIAEPRLAKLELYRRHEGSPIEVLLGDSRRLLAGQALAKADAYFHSGMYPSIFDNRTSSESSHLSGGTDGDEHSEDVAKGFLGEPKDIIDRFSRSFFPSQHRHLGEDEEEHFPGDGHDHGADDDHAEEHGDQDDHAESEDKTASEVREILPWLRLTAELDPNRIDNYIVASYWLRNRLGKVNDAEQFLRLGLKHNPNSYEILFELGRIHDENKHDAARARNLFEAALTRWRDQNANKKEPDNFSLLQIATHLANLEINAGNIDKGIALLEIVKKVSPYPQAAEKRIAELRSGKVEPATKSEKDLTAPVPRSE